MRRLSALCRKLRRYGYSVVVVCERRGVYSVHYQLGNELCPGCIGADNVRVFSTVRACERFLLDLFKED